MRENIEKTIKRWLKRKVTITLGMMVAFMITGGVVYSNDGVINESVIFKVVDGKIVAEIGGQQTKIGNPWTNNGKIDVTEGNGVIIDSSVTEGMNFSLVNSGVISGNGSSDNYSGNGIYNESGRIENLTNNGIISGSNNILGYDSGNGIYNRSETIENLINNGIISSSGLGKDSGNGVYNNYGTIENLINNGIISVNSSSLEKFDGNGIVNNGERIKYLTNSGVISGDNNSSEANSGNGIYNYLGTIESLINNGIISGKSSNLSESSGNGIYTLESKINLLNNNGIISGESNNSDWYSGNGIHNYTETIENLTNNGIILGKSSDVERCLGNGIYNYVGTIGDLINNGIISGSSNKTGYRSGNGIDNYQGTITKLINYGIIAGSNKAINTEDGTITTQNNYGLLIDGAGKTDDTFKIVVGESKKIEDGEYAEYEIKNTFTKGEYKYSDIASKENDIILSNDSNKLIINGYNKGLKVNNDLTLSNSIVNSYTTAINIESGNFIGNNIIVNGGADKKYNDEGEITNQSATIKGSTNTDNLTLKGNSIINGNIDLGAGDDKLSIDNTVQLNGDLLDEDGNDTLTFNNNGVSTFNNGVDNNINIFNKVEGFENINVATDVTLFESAEVIGAKNITIQENGNLILRIDGTEKDGEGNVVGHALYNNIGSIKVNGGKLNLKTFGFGEEEIIAFNNTDITGLTNDDITISSILHKSEINSNNTISITAKKDLEDMDITNYEKLNKIYHSIVGTNLKEFDVPEEKYGAFLKYITDIYAGNSYSFSSALSRKSVNMFSDVVMGRDLHPEVNKWAIYGGLTHIDGGTKDTYFGKGYYTYDIGSKDIDVDSKITGMYAQGEYGVNETLNLGVIFGGNQSESEINSSSKVEGDSFYLGAYAKKYLGNLRLLAGVGYQYGDYEADRVAVGYEGITTTRTFDSNYNDNTFNIYAQGKYSNKLAENLYLEPSVALDYTYVNQEGASENGVLAIETDSKDFNYTTAKFGVDLRKDIPTTTATHSLVAGTYYNRMLDGYEEENITGRFVGGSDFDILVSPSNKHEVGLRAKYEVSLNNGVTFDVKGSYTFERESYSGENKNEHKEEWIVGAGIGYRF